MDDPKPVGGSYLGETSFSKKWKARKSVAVDGVNCACIMKNPKLIQLPSVSIVVDVIIQVVVPHLA